MAIQTPNRLGAKSTTATTDSIVVTVSSNARQLVLVEWSRCNTSFDTQKLTDVSIGASTFTAGVARVYNSERGTVQWRLKDPPTGSQTIDLTRANAADAGTVVVVELNSDDEEIDFKAEEGKASFTQSDSDVAPSIVSTDILLTSFGFLGDETTNLSWDDTEVTELSEDSDGNGNKISVGYDTTRTGTPTVAYSHDQGANKTMAVVLAVYEEGAALSVAVTNLTATDNPANGEVDLTWTNAENDNDKRITHWRPGEDPEVDLPEYIATLAGTSESYSAPRPKEAGTHTYGVEVLDANQTVLALTTATVVIDIIPKIMYHRRTMAA